MRAGIVAEGKTDHFIFEAILQSIAPGIQITRILPEYDAVRRVYGEGGWGRVKNWCQIDGANLEAYMKLIKPRLDMLVIHLDADVAPDLDLAKRCVSAARWSNVVRRQVKAWLGGKTPPDVVITVPCLRTETWIHAALVRPPLGNLECNPDVDQSLVRVGLQTYSRRGKNRKKAGRYKQIAPKVASGFDRVRSLCAEAERFKTAVEIIAQKRSG